MPTVSQINPPVGSETKFQLSLFRISYCFITFLVHFLFYSDFYEFRFLNNNYQTLFSFDYYSNSYFGISGFLLIRCFFLTALLFAGFGIFTRTALLLSAISCFLYEYPISSVAHLHTSGIVFFTLLLMTFLPGIDYLSLDRFFRKSKKTKTQSKEENEWSIRALILLPALAYLSSFYAKLHLSGIQWISGETLQAVLLERYLLTDNILTLNLSSSLWMCALMSIFTLFFEGTFWIVVFYKKLRIPYALTGITLHCLIWYVMGINFVMLFCHSYLIFVPWEKLLQMIQFPKLIKTTQTKI